MRLDWKIRLLVAVLALCAFGRTITSQFTLDDQIHITENPRLRSADAGTAALFEPMYPGNLYRPVVAALNLATYSWFGLNPLPFHLTNLALHACIALLVLELFSRAGMGRAAPLGAALFAVHPLHTEAVANVSGHAELLAALFAVWGCVAALRRCGSRRGFSLPAQCGFALLAFLAAGSKESGCLAPVLTAIVLFGAEYKRGVIAKLLSAQLTGVALYLAARWYVLGAAFSGGATIDFADNPIAVLDPGARALNGFAALTDYLRLILMPWGFSADYSWAARPLLSSLPDMVRVLAPAAALLALAAAGAGMIRRRPAALMMAWFFAAFALTANVFIPIGTNFGERLAYLPSVGAIGCVCALLTGAHASVVRCLWILVPLLAALSVRQSAVWHDNGTLWRYQERVSPLSTKTQTNLAVLYRNEGDFERARGHALRAIEIYPKNEDAWRISASLDIFSGDPKSAAEKLETALNLNPRNTATLGLYGRVLFNGGDLTGALRAFERILQIDRHSIEARIGLYGVGLASGDLERAARIGRELDAMGVTDSEYLALKRQAGDKLSREHEVQSGPDNTQR